MTLQRQNLSQEIKKTDSESGFSILSTFTLSLLDLALSQNEKGQQQVLPNMLLLRPRQRVSYQHIES